MKPIIWADHATQDLAEREIPKEEVLLTINNPGWIVPSYNDRKIYMKRYHDSILGYEMLLRVIIKETTESLYVISVYKTSQFHRYLRDLPK